MRLAATTTKSILILTALAVLVAGQAIPSPAPASAAEGSRPFSPFGMNSHPMWGYGQATIDAELDAMVAAGAHWLRFDADWRDAEPTKGSYSSSFFSQMNMIVAAAESRGIEVQVDILGTPGWANGGASLYTPPTNDADFANFINKMVSTYKGRIRYWEIWNEPNIPEFWKPAPDAARYTRLLKAAYTAAKQADPQAIVISGGLSCSDKQYLQEMYDAGAQGYFDLLGVHPYTGLRSPYYRSDQYDREWNFDGIADMRTTMDANGDTGKHIWAGETGWPTASAPGNVTEAQQAQYVTEAYKRVFEEFPYVDALIIYNLRNKGTDLSPENNLGLLRKDFSRKPAYDAFAQASRTMWPSATITAARTALSYGQSTTLNVSVTPPGATPVVVQRMAANATQWEDVTSTATMAEGTVQVSVAPTATTSYRAVLQGRGLATNTVTVKVRARATIGASRRIVRRLRAVRISGRILPAPGTTVVVQRKKGRRWINVRRATTNSIGRFALKLRHRRSGRYYYRVRFQGNPSHLGTYSRSVRLTVR